MKKQYYLYPLMCISLCLISFSSQCQTKVTHTTKKVSVGEGKHIVSAPIITKSFVKKNSKATRYAEYHVQLSTQDYFIKFCESKISRKELENHLSETEGEIKTLTIELELLDGFLDICNKNEMQQSRTGNYAIIHRIIKHKKE
jgi:hypothetical protein